MSFHFLNHAFDQHIPVTPHCVQGWMRVWVPQGNESPCPSVLTVWPQSLHRSALLSVQDGSRSVSEGPLLCVPSTLHALLQGPSLLTRIKQSAKPAGVRKFSSMLILSTWRNRPSGQGLSPRVCPAVHVRPLSGAQIIPCASDPLAISPRVP